MFADWEHKLIFFLALLCTLYVTDYDFKLGISVLVVLGIVTLIAFALANKTVFRRTNGWLWFLATIAASIGLVVISVAHWLRPIVLALNSN